jgi:predicted amidohydrolase YtcJ
MSRHQSAITSKSLLIFATFVAIFAIAVFLIQNRKSIERADVVIINTKVFTSDTEGGLWTEAIAIKNDKILAVGTTEKIAKFIDQNTKIYDGHTMPIGMVTPGLHDCHIHFLTGGFSLMTVDLRDAPTREAFVTRIANYTRTLASGKWVREGNWNHENWGGELPTHDWIDDVTTNNPVWICRLDGHMCLANTLAMKLANITITTPEVDGGTIVRDKNGFPTGIFKDNAMQLIQRAIPPHSPEEEDKAIETASNYVISQGVTSVHHMGTWRELEAFERAHNANKLKLRVYDAVPLSTWERLAEKVERSGRGDQWLKFGNLKAFTDGSLGSHTALMFDPYIDTENDTGLALTPWENISSWTQGADAAGLHVSIHAIGDKAVHNLLNIFEEVTARNGPKDRRFRIEHSQTVRMEDRPRFARNNIIASMQPYHLIDDGQWAHKLLSEQRIRDLYVIKSLLDNGTKVAFGSDWFVAPPIPLQGIFAAVTRSTLDGKNHIGWTPEQKITLEQALIAYTADASYASFDESVKGKLKEGMLADIVVFDKDLSAIEPHDIWNAKVKMTFIGGKLLYEQ